MTNNQGYSFVVPLVYESQPSLAGPWWLVENCTVPQSWPGPRGSTALVMTDLWRWWLWCFMVNETMLSSQEIHLVLGFKTQPRFIWAPVRSQWDRSCFWRFSRPMRTFSAIRLNPPQPQRRSIRFESKHEVPWIVIFQPRKRHRNTPVAIIITLKLDQIHQL